MSQFLETERFIIKKPNLAEIGKWIAVSTQETREPLNVYMQRCIADWEKFGFSMGSVFDKKTGEFVARAGLYYFFQNDVPQEIELGCFIAKKHRNKGVGTELTIAMIDWGFENLPIERLTGLSRVELHNSHNCLEKSGMQAVETLTIDGEELVLFELRRDTWLQMRVKRQVAPV